MESLMNKTYHVKYVMTFPSGKVKGIDVSAKSKQDAYVQATYSEIPYRENALPYASWVSSVTYNNGNYKEFNTFIGKPY